MSLLRPARHGGAHERLDSSGHHHPTLSRSLGQVAAVNRWLGGWRALLRHLPELLPGEGPARVLDVATGSGDGPLVLARWARRHGRDLRITASDNHPEILEVARRRTAGEPAIAVEAADALRLPFPDAAFDAALLTLTLHHFEPEEAVQVLRELARVARGGIIVSDLDRTWANYAGALLLSWTIWARNPLTRHDGPLSVLRAYTAREIEELARRAGLRQARVHRHVFERLVLVSGGGTAPGAEQR
jgi:ubiquinone/menaquinone biosynthesis C-methylase UbiE